MTHRKPEDLFRAEKERALTVRNSQHARLLAEAKAAFDKLMAEGQAARKSGRPRKHPLPPLKTSSSRTPTAAQPPRPVAPPPAPATVSAKPAPPATAAASRPAAPPAKAVKPAVTAAPAAKVAKPAKAVRAKKVAKAAAKPATKPAGKSKTKPKRATRR